MEAEASDRLISNQTRGGRIVQRTIGFPRRTTGLVAPPPERRGMPSMGPDYWFVIAGVAALCMGAVNLAGALYRRRSRAFVSGCLWLCLSAGLLLQGYSPHPTI